jgi:hypothetical protein
MRNSIKLTFLAGFSNKWFVNIEQKYKVLNQGEIDEESTLHFRLFFDVKRRRHTVI